MGAVVNRFVIGFAILAERWLRILGPFRFTLPSAGKGFFFGYYYYCGTGLLEGNGALWGNKKEDTGGLNTVATGKVAIDTSLW